MHTPRIRRASDDARQPVIRAEIVGRPGVFVTLDEADYDALTATRGNLRFYLVQSFVDGPSYVRIKDHSVLGQLALVSRTIMQPGRGQVVRYRNEDHLDLRRRNLVVTGGGKRTGQTPRIDEFSGLTVEQSRAAFKRASRAAIPAGEQLSASAGGNVK